MYHEHLSYVFATIIRKILTGQIHLFESLSLFYKMLRHKIESPELKRKKVLAALSEAADADGDFHGYEPLCDILDGNVASSRNSSLGETIRTTLLEINEIQERNRERRHKELLALLNKLFSNESPVEDASLRYSEKNFEDDHNTGDRSSIINKHLQTDDRKVDKIEATVVQNVNSNILKPATGAVNITSKNVTNKNIKCPSSSKVIASKNKSEILQMRAQMLEMQRKKMEDRERKKQECLQMKKHSI